MGKLYKNMTPQEKETHKATVERYRKAHPDIYRKAALTAYYKGPVAAAIRAVEWRLANLDYIKQKQREDKRLRKIKAVEYLGGRCNRCGKDWHPSIFEFHHRDPSIKEKDPSKMLSLKWERITAELDKCDLLCANCHRLTHHEGNYS